MKKETANKTAKPAKKKIFRKLLKWIIITIIALVLLIAGAVYYIYNYMNWQGVVRDLVHTYGSQVTGTDVNIGHIRLSLKSGNGGVESITVGNPKDYTQKYIIKLNDVNVSVDKKSITRIIKELAQKTGSKTKTVVIDEIKVEKPEIAYELFNLNRNNADDLMKNITQNTAANKKAPQEAEKASADGYTYNVAIKKVTIANGVATVGANLMGISKSLSLNLPTITINNLGTENQGITIEDGLARIFQEILKTTTNVVAKADLKSLLGSVGDLAGAAKDQIGNVAGAAAEQAGNTAKAATDGLKSGVNGLSQGVGGLFK